MARGHRSRPRVPWAGGPAPVPRRAPTAEPRLAGVCSDASRIAGARAACGGGTGGRGIDGDRRARRGLDAGATLDREQLEQQPCATLAAPSVGRLGQRAQDARQASGQRRIGGARRAAGGEPPPRPGARPAPCRGPTSGQRLDAIRAPRPRRPPGRHPAGGRSPPRRPGRPPRARPSAVTRSPA